GVAKTESGFVHKFCGGRFISGSARNVGKLFEVGKNILGLEFAVVHRIILPCFLHFYYYITGRVQNQRI
ncbi:MAG: hypothetical protein IJ334_05065, partial [Clostridia bacterium]|nr:hypothetical protein [Clostridia bacterium]